MDEREQAWADILAAVRGHGIDRITVLPGDDRVYLYIECRCGETFDTFDKDDIPDEYAMHMVRLATGH